MCERQKRPCRITCCDYLSLPFIEAVVTRDASKITGTARGDAELAVDRGQVPVDGARTNDEQEPHYDANPPMEVPTDENQPLEANTSDLGTSEENSATQALR